MEAVAPPRFSMQFTALATDVDVLDEQADHVTNLVHLRWAQEVSWAHSRAVGCDIAEYRGIGGMMVIRRNEVDYLAQVRLGDVITAETWVDSWRLASCIRKVELTRDGKLVSRIATTWALLSVETGRPLRIPDYMRAKFS